MSPVSARVGADHTVLICSEDGVVLRCACGWICLLGSQASPQLITLSVLGHAESMQEAEDS